MERKAEVLRTIEIADGERLKPGSIVESDMLASWREQNVDSMIKDGRLRIIEEGSGDTTELRAQNTAQAERIRELEAMLKDNDLMFDASRHMTKFGQPVMTRGGKYRRKTRS